MALDIGINFRATAGFVTDGPNETYSIEELYPITRGGATFGWESMDSNPTRNRDNGIDRRLAGLFQQQNDGVQRVFRLDLDATGEHAIHLALGDANNEQAPLYVQFIDNAAVIATIDDTDGTQAANFDDATGANRTAVAWPGDEVSISHTFTSTIFRIRIGSPDAQLGSSSPAHLRLVELVSGVAIPIFGRHYRAMRSA